MYWKTAQGSDSGNTFFGYSVWSEMNSTNPMYDSLSKIAKESNAAIVDVASFTK